MRSEAEIQKTIEDHKKVENFYKETLNNIEIEMEKNQEMAKTLGGEEKVIRNKIDKLESEKKKIMDEPSNHVNNNVENRLKDFGLEKTIFDKDNEIKKLEKELELKQRTNEIEIRYLKDKNKQLEKDYEKYYDEKITIDKAIFIYLLGSAINIGEIKEAKRIKEENDMVFANLLK